jgi:hypothetical protein
MAMSMKEWVSGGSAGVREVWWVRVERKIVGAVKTTREGALQAPKLNSQ